MNIKLCIIHLQRATMLQGNWKMQNYQENRSVWLFLSFYSFCVPCGLTSSHYIAILFVPFYSTMSSTAWIFRIMPLSTNCCLASPPGGIILRRCLKSCNMCALVSTGVAQSRGSSTPSRCSKCWTTKWISQRKPTDFYSTRATSGVTQFNPSPHLCFIWM